MATLSDTPTPTMLTSEAGGVSIKIEQGVLRENDDEYEGSGYNAVRRCIPNIQYESNHPPDMENGMNGVDNDNFNIYPISHSIFQPDVEFKTEPPFDIDDSHPDDESEVATIHPPNNSTPKIRLTPTSKLIATPNGTIDNKRRYVCPYENCTKSYGKSSHLRSHLTWHTGIKPFVCKEPGCGKGFTRSDELNRHIRTHTGEKPFECVQCTKKFSRSDHLTKHLATHTKQLAACIKALAKKKKTDIKVTQETQKESTALISTTNVENKNPYSEGMKFETTSVTNSTLNYPEVITDHVETTTQEVSIKIKLEKPENDDEYKIALPAQETETSLSPTQPTQQIELNIKKEPEVIIKNEPLDDTRMSENTELSHENEPDDNAIMPEANLPAITQITPTSPIALKATASPLVKATLNRAKDSVYDPSRPFPCYVCTKNFKRQDDLNRHMRTHTGEKPFACNECDKRFMRSDHLKKHMNTHTRVKPGTPFEFVKFV